MDGVGELDVAKSLSKFKILTALTKQHTLSEINNYESIKDFFKYIALSTGTSEEGYERLNKILMEHSFFQYICIDIANGYSEHFSKFVSSVREKHQQKQ